MEVGRGLATATAHTAITATATAHTDITVIGDTAITATIADIGLAVLIVGGAEHRRLHCTQSNPCGRAPGSA